MPTVDRWLLPDGIDEVLPREAVRIESARRQLLDLFSRWGYDLVITPHIEYLESFVQDDRPDVRAHARLAGGYYPSGSAHRCAHAGGGRAFPSLLLR